MSFKLVVSNNGGQRSDTFFGFFCFAICQLFFLVPCLRNVLLSILQDSALMENIVAVAMVSRRILVEEPEIVCDKFDNLMYLLSYQLISI